MIGYDWSSAKNPECILNDREGFYSYLGLAKIAGYLHAHYGRAKAFGQRLENGRLSHGKSRAAGKKNEFDTAILKIDPT